VVKYNLKKNKKKGSYCDSGISIDAIFVDGGREGIHVNHKAISFLS